MTKQKDYNIPVKDYDIPVNHFLWDVPTSMKELHMSRYLLMRLAKDAGAIVRVGDRVFIAVDLLRKYINLIAG